MVKLGEICEKKIDTINSNYAGIIDYIDISSVDNQKKTITDTQRISFENAPSRAKQLVIPGDILVSTVRPNLNAVALVTEATDNVLIASTGYCVLRCLPSVDNKYVFYFCQSSAFVDKLVGQATGASYPAVTSSIVKQCSIPLPDLEEQRHIAAVLDKVTDLIAKRRAQLDKLDLLVKSRFVEMFGGINDSSLFPYIPIKEFTNVVSGATPNRSNSQYWDGGTIPWVKTTELRNDKIYDTEEKITAAGFENSSVKMVPAHTILIAMYGQGKTRGMTAYLQCQATTNQACACILPSEKVNQKYLWQYLIFSYEKLRNMAKGGNQPNLNGEIIKNFPVLLPPIEMQTKFSQFKEDIEKHKSLVIGSLNALETLKASLMQQYFG